MGNNSLKRTAAPTVRSNPNNSKPYAEDDLVSRFADELKDFNPESDFKPMNFYIGKARYTVEAEYFWRFKLKSNVHFLHVQLGPHEEIRFGLDEGILRFLPRQTIINLGPVKLVIR